MQKEIGGKQIGMNKDGGTKQQKRSKTKEITNSKLEINNTK